MFKAEELAFLHWEEGKNDHSRKGVRRNKL